MCRPATGWSLLFQVLVAWMTTLGYGTRGRANNSPDLAGTRGRSTPSRFSRTAPGGHRERRSHDENFPRLRSTRSWPRRPDVALPEGFRGRPGLPRPGCLRGIALRISSGGPRGTDCRRPDHDAESRRPMPTDPTGPERSHGTCLRPRRRVRVSRVESSPDRIANRATAPRSRHVLCQPASPGQRPEDHQCRGHLPAPPRGEGRSATAGRTR